MGESVTVDAIHCHKNTISLIFNQWTDTVLKKLGM